MLGTHSCFLLSLHNLVPLINLLSYWGINWSSQRDRKVSCNDSSLRTNHCCLFALQMYWKQHLYFYVYYWILEVDFVLGFLQFIPCKAYTFLFTLNSTQWGKMHFYLSKPFWKAKNHTRISPWVAFLRKVIKGVVPQILLC